MTPEDDMDTTRDYIAKRPWVRKMMDKMHGDEAMESFMRGDMPRYGNLPGCNFSPYEDDVTACIDSMELQMMRIKP
jgi:hypothetical protein